MDKPTIVKIAEEIRNLKFNEALRMSRGFSDIQIDDNPSVEKTFETVGLDEVNLALCFSSWADGVINEWNVERDREAPESD